MPSILRYFYDNHEETKPWCLHPADVLHLPRCLQLTSQFAGNLLLQYSPFPIGQKKKNNLAFVCTGKGDKSAF